MNITTGGILSGDTGPLQGEEPGEGAQGGHVAICAYKPEQPNVEKKQKEKDAKSTNLLSAEEVEQTI
jgi:hypothetical protein